MSNRNRRTHRSKRNRSYTPIQEEKVDVSTIISSSEPSDFGLDHDRTLRQVYRKTILDQYQTTQLGKMSAQDFEDPELLNAVRKSINAVVSSGSDVSEADQASGDGNQAQQHLLTILPAVTKDDPSMNQDRITKDVVNDYSNLTDEVIGEENADVQRDVESKMVEQSADVDTGFIVGTTKEGYNSHETGDQLHDAITKLALDDFPELMTVQDDIFVDGPSTANSEHLSKIRSITSQIFGIENDLLILYVLYVLGFRVTQKETIKIEKIYKRHVLLSIKERISAIALEGGTIFKSQGEPIVSDSIIDSDSSSSEEENKPYEIKQESSHTDMGQNGSMTDFKDAISTSPSEEDVKNYLKQQFASGSDYVTVLPAIEETANHDVYNDNVELSSDTINKVTKVKVGEVATSNQNEEDINNCKGNTDKIKEAVNFEASTSAIKPNTSIDTYYEDDDQIDGLLKEIDNLRFDLDTITVSYQADFSKQDGQIKTLVSENNILKDRVSFLEDIVSSDAQRVKEEINSLNMQSSALKNVVSVLSDQLSKFKVTLPNVQTSNTIKSSMIFTPPASNDPKSKVCIKEAPKQVQEEKTNSNNRPLSTSSNKSDQLASLRRKLALRSQSRNQNPTLAEKSIKYGANKRDDNVLVIQDDKASVITSSTEVAAALMKQSTARNNMIKSNQKALANVTKLDFSAPDGASDCSGSDEKKDSNTNARDAEKPKISSIGSAVAVKTKSKLLRMSELTPVFTVEKTLGLNIAKALYDQMTTASTIHGISPEMSNIRKKLSDMGSAEEKAEQLSRAVALYEKHVDSICMTHTARNEVLSMLKAHTESLTTFAKFLAVYEILVTTFITSLSGRIEDA